MPAVLTPPSGLSCYERLVFNQKLLRRFVGFCALLFLSFAAAGAYILRTLAHLQVRKLVILMVIFTMVMGVVLAVPGKTALFVPVSQALFHSHISKR